MQVAGAMLCWGSTYSALGNAIEVLGGNEASSGKGEESGLHFECVYGRVNEWETG